MGAGATIGAGKAAIGRGCGCGWGRTAALVTTATGVNPSTWPKNGATGSASAVGVDATTPGALDGWSDVGAGVETTADPTGLSGCWTATGAPASGVLTNWPSTGAGAGVETTADPRGLSWTATGASGSGAKPPCIASGTANVSGAGVEMAGRGAASTWVGAGAASGVKGDTSATGAERSATGGPPPSSAIGITVPTKELSDDATTEVVEVDVEVAAGTGSATTMGWGLTGTGAVPTC